MRLHLVGCLMLVLLLAGPAHAGGPLYVGGPTHVAGAPFHWRTTTPVGYWTDLGGLGTLTKAQADTFTADAFAVWQAVPSATVSFVKSGNLSVDVTGANVVTLANDPNSEINTKTVVLYDVNGSATDALLGAGSSSFVLGFAFVDTSSFSSDGVNNFINLAGAMLNGKFIDGAPNPEISLESFKETFIHEFGHFIGLDHSQINIEVLDPAGRTADNLAGLPTMFPFALPVTPRPTLAPDDVAAVSALYPEPSFAGATARIQGNIRFSDGTTPVQGMNVIARQVDDPATAGVDESRRNAVSTVSGYSFTESAGNPVISGSASPFGSRNQALIGQYSLAGLTPGNYTVEVEAIFPSFIGGSGVGPIANVGFQFPIPGTCAVEFLNSGESDVDACTDKSTITVSPGETRSADTDIILNGTPPRFDAWEGAMLWLPRAPAAAEAEERA